MSLKGSLLAAKDVKYEGLREGIDMIKSLKKARPVNHFLSFYIKH